MYLTDVQRNLFNNKIPTSVDLLSTSDRLQCRRNKSLYVIIAMNASNHHALKQGLKSIKNLSQAHWLLFLDSNSLIEHILQGVYIPLNCEFLVASQLGVSVYLTEVYRVARQFSLTVLYWGQWNPHQGLTTPMQELYIRRKNLQGVKLKVAILKNEPYLIFDRNSSKITNVTGLFGNVWTILQTSLNCGSKYLKSNTWGTLTNGSWNGMIDLVARQKADIAISEFSVTTTRAQVVHFTPPIVSTKMMLFIKQKREPHISWTAYLEPFTSAIWWSLLLTIAVLAGSLSFTHSCGGCDETSIKAREAAYTILSIFCLQGNNVRGSFTSRLVFWTAYITSVIIAAAYSARLVAVLAVDKPQLPFSTFEELLKVNSYAMGTSRGSGPINNFDNTNNSIFKQIYVQLLLPYLKDLPRGVGEGLNVLCQKDRYTFMATYSRVFSMTDLPCPIVHLPKTAITETMAMVTNKKGPYRTLIDHRIRDLHRYGILAKINKDALPMINHLPDEGFDNVTLEDVVPILAVFSTGVLASILFFLIEHLKHRQHKCRAI